MQRREKGRGRREGKESQNDIKKLRRENEQLRREIWSLRDEYDKLEEILKRQKSRGESDDSEDRSEKDDEERSNCSCEQEDRALDSQEEEEQAEEEEEDDNDDDDDDDEEKGRLSKDEDDRAEQLENAENQKISSEKMNGGGNHRLLHVDFDDLSVVDEEEELKKEREKKETITCHDQTHNETSKSQQQQQQQQQNIVKIARRLQDNVPFYPGTYHSTSGGYPAPPYFVECPFDLGNCTESPQDAPTVLPSPCPDLYSDAQVQLGDLDSPMNLNDEALLPEQLHVPPLEWRQADAIVEESLVGASYPIDAPPTIPLLDAASPLEYENYVDAAAATAKYRVFKAFDKTHPYDIPRRRETPLNGWLSVDPSDRSVAQEDATATWPESEKRRHFFAPLSSKTKKQTEEESPTASANCFGTGTSSSSGRTASTVVSRSNPFFLPGQKGCVDVCVNGAVSYGNESRLDRSVVNFARDNREEQRTFLSTDNLLIDGVKRMSGCEQPVKSLSCQDLSVETQSAVSEGLAKPSSMTKSDNTLDSIISNGNSVRPYRSHLNVTLKIPRHERAIKESQAMGQLQAQEEARLEARRVVQRNPFLQDFQQTSPLTQPLSVQVNETSQLPYDYPVSPVARTLRSEETSLHRPTVETYPRRSGKRPEQNRLLIPSDRSIADFQVTSFERPSPRTIVPSSVPYDFDTLRRIRGNRYVDGRNAYRQKALPFVPFAPPPTLCPQFATLPTFRPNEATVRKVPAQTQTSIDGDSHAEEDRACRRRDEEGVGTLNSPSSQRRKRPVKKEKDEKALSPRALRKLKKQSSSATSSDRPDSPGKCARQRARKQSLTATTTASEGQEEKNESRSSSSGQDSPRKDQIRRTSAYFNPKQRPSLTSIKTARSGSLDVPKDNKYFDATAVSNCDKEGVAIAASAATKNRKSSTSSGSVPWCACWGNGCM